MVIASGVMAAQPVLTVRVVLPALVVVAAVAVEVAAEVSDAVANKAYEPGPSPASVPKLCLTVHRQRMLLYWLKPRACLTICLSFFFSPPPLLLPSLFTWRGREEGGGFFFFPPPPSTTPRTTASPALPCLGSIHYLPYDM